MDWLQHLDIGLFRFINGQVVHPVFDQVMPFLSGNAFFVPAVVVLAGFVLCKYRSRGLIFLLLLATTIALTDGVICRTIKHAIGRDRPFLTLPDVRCLLGKGSSPSMPSAHAANWFAATMVAFVFFRRSPWVMLPLALAVCFSRVYCGVHYPSDVAAGAVLGAGTAAATLWLANELWRWAGRKWFPLWWEKCPSLLAQVPSARRTGDETEEEAPQFAPRRRPGEKPAPAPASPHASLDEHWLRLGYLVIVALLLGRLAYIASDVVQLSKEEAVDWLRTKPAAGLELKHTPVVSLIEFASTALWGDKAFGVRFFAPGLSALAALLLLRFFARHVNARAGFFLVLILTATPILAAGSILMESEFLAGFCWVAAMISGWNAIQPASGLGAWSSFGLWLGLGSLSSYAGMVEVIGLLLFFIVWAPARKHFRRSGPYLAAAVCLICVVPPVIWNSGNLINGLDRILRSRPDGLARNALQQFAVCNPIFLGASIWAALAFWRRNRRHPLLVYCFCMGAPAFLILLFWSLHSAGSWNWIAPALVPLFCLMTIYWDIQWRLGSAKLKPWLMAGLGLGLGAVLLSHETNWVEKIAGHHLLVNLDPLARLRGWSDTARLAADGKPVSIITDNTGLAAEITFYLPEAKNAVKGTPIVCLLVNPGDRVWGWLSYANRKSENAIFVREVTGDNPADESVLAVLSEKFESVNDLGVKNVPYHGQVLRSLQFYACRNSK